MQYGHIHANRQNCMTAAKRLEISVPHYARAAT